MRAAAGCGVRACGAIILLQYGKGARRCSGVIGNSEIDSPVCVRGFYVFYVKIIIIDLCLTQVEATRCGRFGAAR